MDPKDPFASHRSQWPRILRSKRDFEWKHLVSLRLLDNDDTKLNNDHNTMFFATDASQLVWTGYLAVPVSLCFESELHSDLYLTKSLNPEKSSLYGKFVK
ncbi:hypothetical protein AVEN_176181-1 [Araneus ventricosus]|uniref:Uncharacterized protein n=1 Tax=Araneus ventricosus TaxID=182803 RepID=A0A4Y2CN49_ARAVE|nr:hypothetical protein AVEN_176181-1 [Araneus ventricosus]